MEEDKTSNYDPSLYTDEAKRKRFINMAEKRTNRLLNDLRLLGNTSNKSLYKYERSDVEKIFEEIEKKVTEVKGKFYSGKQSRPFRLE
jgi:hypothetical protein